MGEFVVESSSAGGGKEALGDDEGAARAESPLDLTVHERQTDGEDVGAKRRRAHLEPPLAPSNGASPLRVFEPADLADAPSPDAAAPTPSPAPAATASKDAGFVCENCNILFYSERNYLAHQRFYCSLRKQPDTDDPNGLNVMCKTCGKSFNSENFQKGNLCEHYYVACKTCSQLILSWRLGEHEKQHQPTTAFKCALCGYRGYTVRGMKLHSKMHDCDEQHYFDTFVQRYEEPPIMPNGGDQSPPEAPNDQRTHFSPFSSALLTPPPNPQKPSTEELLAKKVQPYSMRKRKPDLFSAHTVSLQRNVQVFTCRLCTLNFADERSWEAHICKAAPALPSADALLDKFKCLFCDFATEDKVSMIEHLFVGHKLSIKK